MAEYTTNATQTVAADASVLFNDRAAGCSCGISHRQGSGLFTLNGGAAYLVSFGANIAIAEGGTVGPISIALTLDGEPLYASTAIVTPAAVGDFFNIYISAIIRQPCRCCASISVRNVSTPDTPIDVANANLVIARV